MKYENWLFGKDGALFRACSRGKLELAKELVSKGANVNVKSNNGFTSLHRAAQNGHIKLVEFLLGKGVNPSPKAKDNITPLDLAKKNGHSDIYAVLRKNMKD